MAGVICGNMIRSRRNVTLVCGAAALLLVAPILYHATTFHYLEIVENDPLISPTRVVAVRGDIVELEDGRFYELLQGADRLADFAADPDLYIDLEPPESAMPTVFVKRRQVICGTPWARPIRIPIIADRLPANTRDFAGNAIQRKPALEGPK